MGVNKQPELRRAQFADAYTKPLLRRLTHGSKWKLTDKARAHARIPGAEKASVFPRDSKRVSRAARLRDSRRTKHFDQGTMERWR